LLGLRGRVHDDEESYVVVHPGLAGALIHLSSSEMASFCNEGPLYDAVKTGILRKRPSQRPRDPNNVRGETTYSLYLMPTLTLPVR
jgi:hypothetical protein